MVIDLILIGLVITLFPLPVMAYALVLASPRGRDKAWRSSSPGWRAWWP
ncbi:hypothetical protein [Streptomyces sp. QHH-9511]|nr:hypothetical protein [Streptomyces sp. QHH-9511]